MKASHIRGALLEFLVRRLLSNCGFSPVKADGLYTYESGGLFYVNGRGAAHDADVLMDPPVQMPFTYPTRVLFECKAYNTRTSLTIIRNALGLRHDINEFEIVTKESLLQRKNNRRAQYAIEQRNRYNYQVGVACTKEYSRPAFEFAANNKIPLLSMSWFLLPTIDLFDRIDQRYVNGIGETRIYEIYEYLKDRFRDADSRHQHVQDFIAGDNILGRIISSFREIQESLFVGLLETGDIIFLSAQNRRVIGRLLETQNFGGLKARLHYSRRSPELWYLSISDDFNNQESMEFNFYVPPGIMRVWEQFNTGRVSALNIKDVYFSKIFIFNQGIRPDLPFFIVNIDREWLEEVREAENDLFTTDQ